MTADRKPPAATVADDSPIEAVLFADLAGFTSLTEVHGDAQAVDVATHFFALTEQARVGRGVLVKTIGDAVMLAITTATDALDVAMGLHTLVNQQPNFPGVRMGLDIGPVVVRDGDRFGGTVNRAARVAAYARSG